MRTSLTIASTGVGERFFCVYVRFFFILMTRLRDGSALVQLFTISAATTNKALESYSRPIGAVVIFVGLATLLLGLFRYFAIQTALIGGNYPVARVSTILLAVVMCTIIVVVFGIILGVR